MRGPRGERLPGRREIARRFVGTSERDEQLRPPREPRCAIAPGESAIDPAERRLATPCRELELDRRVDQRRHRPERIRRGGEHGERRVRTAGGAQRLDLERRPLRIGTPGGDPRRRVVVRRGLRRAADTVRAGAQGERLRDSRPQRERLIERRHRRAGVAPFECDQTARRGDVGSVGAEPFGARDVGQGAFGRSEVERRERPRQPERGTLGVDGELGVERGEPFVGRGMGARRSGERQRGERRQNRRAGASPRAASDRSVGEQGIDSTPGGAPPG
jgi:hypothetical protein